MCLVRQQNGLHFLCVLPLLYWNKVMMHQEAQTNTSSLSRLQFQHWLPPVARNKVSKKQSEIASHLHVKFVTTGKWLDLPREFLWFTFDFVITHLAYAWKTPVIWVFSSDGTGLVRQRMASGACAWLPLLNTFWSISLGEKKNLLVSPSKW